MLLEPLMYCKLTQFFQIAQPTDVYKVQNERLIILWCFIPHSKSIKIRSSLIKQLACYAKIRNTCHARGPSICPIVYSLAHSIPVKYIRKLTVACFTCLYAADINNLRDGGIYIGKCRLDCYIENASCG